MSIGEGTEPYAKLLRTTACDIVGFEPIVSELDKLRATAPSNQTFLPFIVGDGSEQAFRECNAPMTSSLLEPRRDVVDQFHQLGNLMRVVARTPVITKRLDDLPEVAGADYLKMDVQGGELMVLQGATDVLKTVAAVHTEVSSVPMYENQPLLGDIDVFLRSQGFLMHRFASVSGRAFKPLLMRNDPHATMSQALWGDVVYVKSFTDFHRQSPTLLLKLALILHENYQSFDLAAVALREHDKLTDSSLVIEYIQKLTGQAS